MAPTPYAVILGSSRGIGRELTRQYLSRTGLNVVALSRSPDQAIERILGGDGPSLDGEAEKRLTSLAIDVRKEESIEKAAKEVKERFGEDLRLLINVAGILHVEKSIRQISYEEMLEQFQINTFAPLLSFKHFVPLLPKRIEDEGPVQGMLPEKSAVLASLSARVGSIGENEKGGWYSYRASKAAQNQITRTLSRELAMRKTPAIALGLHPGTVRTELSKAFTGGPGGIGKDGKPRPKPKGEFEADEAAQNLVEVIKSRTSEDSGFVFNYEGEKLPY